MKIEGVIRVQGVDLHVDIEVPDSASRIYVTNVHSSTLVIPPERLELRYLALSKATLLALEAKRVETLADLVDQQGNLRSLKLSPKAKAEIEQVLGALRKAALVFNWNEKATKDSTVINPSDVQVESVSERHLMNGHVKNLKLEEMLEENRPGTRKRLLSVQQIESLQERGVQTIGDLVDFGEENLLMTRGFDLSKIADINRWLQSRGTPVLGSTMP